jgi:outer membrane protein
MKNISRPFCSQGVRLGLCALLCGGCATGDRSVRRSPGAPVPTMRTPLAVDASTTAPNPAPPLAAAQPLTPTLSEALRLALTHNRSLRVQRLEPGIRSENEIVADSVFDTALTGEIAETRRRGRPPADGSDNRETGGSLKLGARKQYAFGTLLELALEAERATRDGQDDLAATRLGLTVTQPLRRGAGREVNRIAVRLARLDTQMSRHELQAVAEALAARVESVYLDGILARRRLEIVEASLRLAVRQREETRQRIRVGGLPGTELAAAEAEVAVRQEARIDAQSRLAALRLRLARLIQPERLARPDPALDFPAQAPATDDTLDPLETHLDSALRLRSDLNQARLRARRGDLELIRTADGLLPRLDLFARLGKSGYAAALADTPGEMGGDGYDATLGLGFEWPTGNRAGRARQRGAERGAQQLLESLRNIEDLVREDIHLAHLEVRRAQRQREARAATRILQEEKLRAETVKFDAGQSTSLFVAQAQRDLLAAQVAEAEAAMDYRKALTELYRLDGSLLPRRGIAVSGS